MKNFRLTSVNFFEETGSSSNWFICVGIFPVRFVFSTFKKARTRISKAVYKFPSKSVNNSLMKPVLLQTCSFAEIFVLRFAFNTFKKVSTQNFQILVKSFHDETGSSQNLFFCDDFSDNIRIKHLEIWYYENFHENGTTFA